MLNKDNVVLIVLVGTAVMLILVLAIIAFVVIYNKKISIKENAYNLMLKNKEVETLRAVIDSKEAEQDKIASNLHDEIGPLLSTLKLNLTMIERRISKGTIVIEDVKKERGFLDEIIDNVRLISHDLSPSFLLKFGIKKALENYLSKISDVDVKFRFTEDYSEELSKQQTINLYRIVLELLNNILKHDKPSSVTVTFVVSESRDSLIGTIRHDGVGIDNEMFKDLSAKSKGLGLNSIHTRVVVLKGVIDFKKEKNGGIVRFSIPLNN